MTTQKRVTTLVRFDCARQPFFLTLNLEVATLQNQSYAQFRIEGFRPEWYILTIYHCRDIPIWSETLDIQHHPTKATSQQQCFSKGCDTPCLHRLVTDITCRHLLLILQQVVSHLGDTLRGNGEGVGHVAQTFIPCKRRA